MANVKQGHLNGAPQWWKHLRDWKKVFWHAERQSAKTLTIEELADHKFDTSEYVLIGLHPARKAERTRTTTTA